MYPRTLCHLVRFRSSVVTIGETLCYTLCYRDRIIIIIMDTWPVCDPRINTGKGGDRLTTSRRCSKLWERASRIRHIAESGAIPGPSARPSAALMLFSPRRIAIQISYARVISVVFGHHVIVRLARIKSTLAAVTFS